MTRLAPVLLVLVLGGCGAKEQSRPAAPATPAGWTTHRDTSRGVKVSLPAGWQRAEKPVSPLTDPREVLAAGTYPLRYRPTNCDAFAGSARQDLRPADALVTIQERGYDRSSEWLDFPSRPRRFPTTGAEGPEPACGDRPGTTTHWLPFTDAGRHFYALLVIGPDAPASVRKEAFAVLDSLRFDASAKPTWRASG